MKFDRVSQGKNANQSATLAVASIEFKKKN